MGDMEARVKAGLTWMRATTAYKTKVNPNKDRSLRGKARRKARKKAKS